MKLNGESYSIIKSRAHDEMVIYQGDRKILRVGPPDLILSERTIHESFLNSGFPVPELFETGELDGQTFSLEQVFPGHVIAEEWARQSSEFGAPSQEFFDQLTDIMRSFSVAQLGTSSLENSFRSGVHLDIICDELPEQADQLRAGFARLQERTNVLPTVLTHGDCNVFNIFPDGVIDFGSSFWGPIGYDIVTLLYHTYLFPVGEYEITRRGEFSLEQRTSLIATMDTLYNEHGVAPLSHFVDDFIFARSLWSTTRMHRYPKLQAWRYLKLQRMTERYLQGEEIQSVLMAP